MTELNRNYKKQISKQYESHFLELRVIVNSFDPLGLVAGGAPENEHDNITQKLISLLYDDRLDEVKSLLKDCYEEYGFNTKEEINEKFKNKIESTYKQVEDWYKQFRQI
ncbi:hypothetical protein [Paenibacillus piri]|uniref:Uncharacterized protein n=1 Tax=Paenibacillus piri TaxID=2547395 RepID=A0A4R5KEK7_9BACL|nr:hypothetical protein [Paenibacillus piri]TDF93829.1 hypothetical protein E1757_25950 [Paenibacillus piri]